MKNKPYERLLQPPTQSFFLLGPRSVGKSFWLRKHFQHAVFFDLLENRIYLELSRDPSLLEAKIGKQPQGTWVYIDEIQKIPALLDEVHRLITKHHWNFALSGSSARKLKRSGANLLAGRALTKRMEGLTFAELGKDFELKKALEWGSLPLVYQKGAQSADILAAYVHTYLREEIREEGLLRKTEPFIRFLEVAGLMNGQLVNKENIARDAKVPRSTVDVYFSILEDTLVGHFLPAYQPGAKVRETAHPKFFWFDSGVARGAANLLYDPADETWLGRSLETLIYHELRVYNEISSKHRKIAYYQTGAGAEIDFIIELKKRTLQQQPQLICLEVKKSRTWRREWESAARSLAESKKVQVKRMIGIYSGKESYHFDGFDVLPVEEFLSQLHNGKVF